MLYAMLCYHREAEVAEWSADREQQVLASHDRNLQKPRATRKLGPVARLMPTTTAVTLRAGKQPLVLDGPFAETKEQLLGFYVFECGSLEEAIQIGRGLVVEGGSLEIRPVMTFEGGSWHP